MCGDRHNLSVGKLSAGVKSVRGNRRRSSGTTIAAADDSYSVLEVNAKAATIIFAM